SQHASAVELYEGEEFVMLTCEYQTVNLDDPTVVWRRSDLNPSTVHQHLQKERFPNWAKVLVVMAGLVAGAPLIRFRHYFMSGPEVEVDSGAESVQLPFKTTADLPKDVTVEWMYSYWWNVHVYQNMFFSSDRLEKQFNPYRGRTEMKKNWRQTGDLSLILKYPTDADTETYSCKVYNRKRKILMKKQVELKVKVCQVEVDSGAKSVQLPFKTTADLPEDVRVEWMYGGNRKVHVYEKGSDQSEEQDYFYRNQTEMKEDLLQTGDLSLILKYPTDRDTGVYSCTIYYNKEESVRWRWIQEQSLSSCPSKPQLTCLKTSEWSGRTETTGWSTFIRNGSDQPEEQFSLYRGRTEMKEDLLQTGDLSLILKYPTDADTGEFRCIIYKEGNILRWKTVELKVKDQYEDTGKSKGGGVCFMVNKWCPSGAQTGDYFYGLFSGPGAPHDQMPALIIFRRQPEESPAEIPPTHQLSHACSAAAASYRQKLKRDGPVTRTIQQWSDQSGLGSARLLQQDGVVCV
ncbi:hypothetical protein L3Q82_011350, partial [Scortum barcoo]